MSYPTQQKQFTIDQFISEFEFSFDFSPRSIFCERTGHVIGTMSEREFNLSIQVIPNEFSLARAIEEHAIKICASSRPSTIFNFLHKNTYEEIMENSPSHLLAYLLSRNFTFGISKPRDENFFENMLTKIQIAQNCENFNYEREDVKQMIYLLIMYDRLFNLATKPIKKFQDVASFFQLPLKEINAILGNQIVSIKQNIADEAKKARMQQKAIEGNLALSKLSASIYKQKRPLSEKQELNVSIASIIADLMDGTGFLDSKKLRAEIEIIKPTRPVATLNGIKLNIFSRTKP